MLLLWQFLSELYDILHNVSVYGVSMCSSRLVHTGLMTSLMTSSCYNRCRNFGAEYLGNEARYQDGSKGQPIGKWK